MTMKKIKSIKQLQAEKKRIQKEQHYLESKIRSDWEEVKESLRPANIAKDTIGNFIRNKTAEDLNDDSIIKGAFTHGLSLLVKKMAGKTGDKFSRIFRK